MNQKEVGILQENPHCNGVKCCINGVRCEFLCHKTEDRCCTADDPVSDCSAENCEVCSDVECEAPNVCVAPDNVCDPETNTCCPGADATCCDADDTCCEAGNVCVAPEDVCDSDENTCCPGVDATCCAATDTCCPEGDECVPSDFVCDPEFNTCCPLDTHECVLIGSTCGEHSSCISDIDIPVPCVQPVPCTVVCKNPSGTDIPNSVAITVFASSLLGLDLTYALVAGQGPFKGTVVQEAAPNQNVFIYTPNNVALGFDSFKVDISTLDNNGKIINTTRITIPVRIDPCFPPPPCDLNCGCCGPDQDCECVCEAENGVAKG